MVLEKGQGAEKDLKYMYIIHGNFPYNLQIHLPFETNTVFFRHACMWTMCLPGACKESTEYHRTGVTGGYEPTCGFTELNLDALHKMQVISTAEPTP